MTHAKVLILHGYMHHRPDGHWLRWLEEQLLQREIAVRYPQLPDADAPHIEAWLEVALRELGALGDGERVVVAHSLGTALWHHAVARGAHADRVIMVAPPSHHILTGDLASFSLLSLDQAAVGEAVPTTVVGRERDPYREGSLEQLAGGWNAELVVLPGDGHINIDDGHGPFPYALDWVTRQV